MRRASVVISGAHDERSESIQRWKRSLLKIAAATDSGDIEDDVDAPMFGEHHFEECDGCVLIRNVDLMRHTVRTWLMSAATTRAP
jgi:hypothetical protein